MKEDQSSTDYAIVRVRPDRFTWGKIASWHDVGRYSIVEYKPYVLNSSPPALKEDNLFHIYVDKKSQGTSASSLESALVTAIALGCLEVNHAHHMSTACLKILEITP